ncbi:MAG: hypothetical protein WD825_06750 [Gemmatimonadaceae bacterium]
MRRFHTRHVLRTPFRDDFSSAKSRFGPEVDHPVRELDDIEVVLDEHHCVSRVHQPVEDVRQLLDVLEMEARGWLVHQVQLPSGPPVRRRELPRDLEALGFASRERRRRLAEPEIAKPHLLELPERLAELFLARKCADRLVHRELKHLMNVPAANGHLEHVRTKALGSAFVAGDVDVRHEHHLDLEIAGALALLAAAAGDVEAECARPIPPLASQRSVGEQPADLVEGFDVRDGIGPR